jgi:DeoR family fructose operon transcriptional repressor
MDGNDVMFATERRQAILDRARAEGRVDVTTLAHHFAVTPETIRRDLAALEHRRLLHRTHGGAVPLERLVLEPRVADREALNVDEKQRIARAALAELPERGTVLLDAGTTTAALARLMPADRDLLVVTNGLEVALLLADHPNLSVQVLGGRLRPQSRALVARWAERILAEIFVDVAFLGSNGISTARGLTTPDAAEAAVKQAMISASRRRIVLADHTKFQADHFARFGELADIDVLITDTALDPRVASRVRSAGPRVVLA